MPRGDKYSSTISSTSALDWGVWLTPRPCHFPSGKNPVPIVQEAGWHQGRSGWVRKISTPLESHLQSVQPVTSRYTDWANPAQGHLHGFRSAHILWIAFNYFGLKYLLELQRRMGGWLMNSERLGSGGGLSGIIAQHFILGAEKNHE